MITRYHIFSVSCVVSLLIAGTAVADRDQADLPDAWTLENIVVGEFVDFKETAVLSYEFVDPVDVYYFSHGQGLFANFGVLPEGTLLTRFGWTDLTLTVHDNGGSLAENWASDIRLGWIYSNGSGGYFYTGAGPFPFDEAGTFGPSSGYVDIIAPSQQTPPENRAFQFSTWSYYNDQTGLPAATWTSGTVYMVVEYPEVDVESSSLSAVKALYR